MRLSKIISRGLFFGLLTLYMIVQSYLVSMLFSGAVLALVMAVWSAVTKMPSLLVEKTWLVYLLSCIPVAVGIYLSMLIEYIKENKKTLQQKDKENNS